MAEAQKLFDKTGGSSYITDMCRAIRPARDGKEATVNDRNGVINQIQDALGYDGSRELAEKIYGEIRRRGMISHDQLRGLVLDDDIDYMRIAEFVERRDGAGHE